LSSSKRFLRIPPPGKVLHKPGQLSGCVASDYPAAQLQINLHALTQQCHYCIALHIRACKQAGVTLDEIMDVCGIAIMMGGGPALTHMAEVERALNEFYLDENGDPI
jgi:AhpD family alkylhydroperoxidase